MKARSARGRSPCSAVASLSSVGAAAGWSWTPHQEREGRPAAGRHNLPSLRSEAEQRCAPGACRRSSRARSPGRQGGKGRRRAEYVELEREATDRIFVVIAEFGDHAAPTHFRRDAAERRATTDVRRARCTTRSRSRTARVDNSTLWQEDYNQAHYDNMYFNRMAEYYETQSSGRYSVDGDVTEWVKVPFNEARYGRTSAAASSATTRWFLDPRRHGVLGRRTSSTPARRWREIQDYLKTFDIGIATTSTATATSTSRTAYIDHFQIVHAGGDEAAGDPQQGTDAIWSHRWYAPAASAAARAAGRRQRRLRRSAPVGRRSRR